MKKSTGLIIIILLLVIAYFLNPGFEKHLAKTQAGTIEEKILEDKDKTITSKLYKYNNYYLFSTTTNTFTGQRATFGIFGIVFGN